MGQLISASARPASELGAVARVSENSMLREILNQGRFNAEHRTSILIMLSLHRESHLDIETLFMKLTSTQYF